MQKHLKINLCPKDAGLYPADDLPDYVQALQAKHTPNPRLPRTDLVQGQVVIVLEGPLAGSRVVYLKPLSNFLALCTGPSSINKIPFFSIDERYLLKTTVMIKIKEKIEINEVPLCSIDSTTVPECEMKGEQKKIDDILCGEIKKVKWMKRYFNTPFSLPEDVEFYSLNF